MARDLRLVAHEWIRELEISGLVNWLIGCSGYQENGEFRIGKLELRMDSVSKPALSKAEWVRNDKVVLKRDCIICEILLDGKVANLV